ncbi:GNAT family N-acetyltransferase [Vibrio mexicanus]|uniref:GNAT family N-acetyltransferase n=1 Tax=Vibrio mexicanus TaxID=1004326 RepID=UPI00063C1D97|nr:GNAT family N-acetyltransferase [Vibrio mexicanus]
MASIVVRQAEYRDLPDIVSIHMSAFPEFFLTSLGDFFLNQYYRLYIKFNHIALVCESEGTLCGFVVGTDNASEFYKDLRSQWFYFLLPVVLNVFNLRLIKKIVTRATTVVFKRRINATDSRYDKFNELISIGVCSAHQAKGIGGRLLAKYLSLCMNKGVEAVYLTTDATDNTKVIDFYKRSGFCLDKEFEQDQSRKMNVLVKYLDK